MSDSVVQVSDVRCQMSDVLSRCFSMVCGVRQGGVISTELFVVYVDDIIDRLNDSKLGAKFDYVSKVKYLGFYIVLTKYFKLSIHESCSHFYKALNGIYSKSKGYMNEMVTFQLITVYCNPLLTYAFES